MRTFSKNYTTLPANAKQVVPGFVKQRTTLLSALCNPQKPTKHFIFFSPKSELEFLCPFPNKTRNTGYMQVLKTHRKRII